MQKVWRSPLPLMSTFSAAEQIRKSGFERHHAKTRQPQRRRWSSSPSEKCSHARPTRGTVCSTMRDMCGAGAGGLAINYPSPDNHGERKKALEGVEGVPGRGLSESRKVCLSLSSVAPTSSRAVASLRWITGYDHEVRCAEEAMRLAVFTCAQYRGHSKLRTHTAIGPYGRSFYT